MPIGSLPEQELCPPHRLRQLSADTRSNQGDLEEEQHTPNHVSQPDYQQIYWDFQAASYSYQKLNLPQSSGEFHGDIFMDWLLQLESIFHYKKFRDSKRVLLIETKLRRGTMH